MSEIRTLPRHLAMCALCRRYLPKAALVVKTLVDLGGRPTTRFYCADALACVDASRAGARTS